MLGLKRLIPRTCSPRASILSFQFIDQEEAGFFIHPSRNFAQKTSSRFLDIYQFWNKAAIKKERARLADEMSRGYFADMSEFHKHGGKIAMANKIIIPAMVAQKFPDFEVSYSYDKMLKLPPRFDAYSVETNEVALPRATLICLSFRSSSQAMVDSWSVPFLDSFADSKDVQLYEVSLIDSWLLSCSPVKRLLLRLMKKSNYDEKRALQRQIVYSFGDYYYFRKDLKIVNLLTGYVYLLDKHGRIRWQGFGLANTRGVIIPYFLHFVSFGRELSHRSALGLAVLAERSKHFSLK